MFLCNITTNAAWVANQPISLASAPSIATNDNVKLNSANNGAVIVNPGWYMVRLECVVAAGGTNVGVQLYTNGNPVASTIRDVTTTQNDDTELIIEYPIHVVSAPSPSQALIQFYATEVGTPASGYVTITKIQ